MMSTRARVLVYDSSVLQCELLSAGLESLQLGLEIGRANDLESMTELLANDPDWLVIISDTNMNGSAISLAKHLREKFDELAFVILLKEGRSDLVIEAFRTGARGIVYGLNSQTASAVFLKVTCGCEESTWE